MENGRLKFGASEWLKLAGLMLSVATVTAGAQFYVVRLLIANHADKVDIHQSSIEQDRLYLSHGEFDLWERSHTRHPHEPVPERLADFEARLRILEKEILK